MHHFDGNQKSFAARLSLLVVSVAVLCGPGLFGCGQSSQLSIKTARQPLMIVVGWHDDSGGHRHYSVGHEEVGQDESGLDATIEAIDSSTAPVLFVLGKWPRERLNASIRRKRTVFFEPPQTTDWAAVCVYETPEGYSFQVDNARVTEQEVLACFKRMEACRGTLFVVQNMRGKFINEIKAPEWLDSLYSVRYRKRATVRWEEAPDNSL